MKEEDDWFDLIGYEGFYQMNSKGEIKNLHRTISNGKNRLSIAKERILKIQIDKITNRKSVKLSKNGAAKTFGIAVLKAKQFIPNPLNLKCVDHIDGDPNNNDLSNLRWTTNADNVKKGYYEDGNHINKKTSIKAILQYAKNGEFIAEHRSASEAQLIFTPSRTTGTISKNLTKPERFKSAYGYIWKYK